MKRTILITGATGYIGGMLVKSILHHESKEHSIGKIILLVRDEEKARAIFEKEIAQVGIEVKLFQTSLENFAPNQLFDDIDYIIHCASMTNSAEMVKNPVSVADGIVLGTRNILELARIKRVKSMVYLSSMEVYGWLQKDGRLTQEDQLGDVDLFSARSCYPMGKRMAEHYCYLYYREYGVPVKIARLAQTFGKGVSVEDNRVFAQFAWAVLADKDIVLHTQGLTMGNYCAIEDVIAALWLILGKGVSGEAYNVVNEDSTMSICDMAHLVADKIAERRINVVYDIDATNIHGYAAETGLQLSADKLRALGWQPSKDLEEMYRDLLAWYAKRLVQHCINN